jgi:hypothetical protein
MASVGPSVARTQGGRVAALRGRLRTQRRAASAAASVVAVLGAGAFLPAVPQAQASFDFLPGAAGFSVTTTNEGGAPDLQAGSHPWELTTTANFKLQEGAPQPGGTFTDGDLKDLHIEEPPGLIENPAAVPHCSLLQFNTPRVSPFEASRSGESCPDKSQLGVVTIRSSEGGGETRSFGVFNLTPPPGVPSQLGFAPFGVPVTLTPHVRQADGEYGLTLDLRSFSQRFDLYGLTLVIWGVPWALTHNTERGDCLNESDLEDPWGKCSVGRPAFNPAKAYLSLPPSCTGPLTTTATADSWQHPGAYLPDGEPDLTDPAWGSATSTTAQGLQGCDLLNFTPAASGRLTTARAASPTGYALSFDQPDEGLTNPKLTAPSQPKQAVVTLPEGMTLNPSLAAGLGVCTPSQYAAETVSSPPGAGCPNAAKIGDFSVQSPLFEEAISGGVFLAQPFDNPFDSLLALYIVAKAPERGIIVKVAGQVSLDQSSGQLTASFDQLPQLPYSHFRVLFREGQRSPLLSPPSCGTYATAIGLHPWLDPETVLQETSPFAISAGIEGGPCPNGSAPPFSPGAAAGNLNSNAGSYTPFYLHLTRRDTEAEITSYSAKLPPGLLGKIAGIPYCPEADIAAAKRETGVGEEARPSCPAASEIGHTLSGYGVGPVLAYAPGRLYLAGPYHGSAFSVVAIDAATVGPFDLGTVIVRSAIRVDPDNAQVAVDSAGSDPIPHIIDGIPIHLRDVRVYLDRPGLTLNPTSCQPFSLSSTLTGSYAPFIDPRADTATAIVPFQVSNCSSLRFAPRFNLKLKGGTKRGDFPSLHATYRPRPGQANLARAAVTLPPTEFLAQEHIDTVCTRPRFEAGTCPPGSVYGRARAFTPLLSEPLEGPVYLGVGFGHRLPDLVVALHGQGITINLDGRIDTSHGGLRGTFTGLPDAPLRKFTLSLFGGRHGVLANERNLCRSPQLASARFLGQNNRGEALRPVIATDCAKQTKGHRRRGGKR